MYRLLLRIFPRAFRDRFGADMTDVFRDRLRGARAGGVAAVIALWGRTAIDVIGHGLSERRAARVPTRVSTRRPQMWQSIGRDLHYGLRSFLKRPFVSVVAVLTLAVGIGATTAVFSVNDALLWRSLPYPHADRLVMVEERNERRGFGGNVAIANFDDWHGTVRGVEAAAAWTTADVNLAGGGEAERVRGALATPGVFELHGARQVVGRGLQDGDRVPGRHFVAVLSEGAWHRLFGGAPGIIGRAIPLDGVPHEVIGVVTSVPALADVDVWRPLLRAEGIPGRRNHAYRAVARLAPGVTRAAAAEEIDGVYAALEVAYPATNAGWRARLTPLQDVMVEDLTATVRLSSAVVAVLLLIACANVANLLLARASERRREFAVRRALGAARARLLRQVLTESVLLAAAGAAAGLVVAWGAMKGLVSVLSVETPLWVTPGLDSRVLAFTLGVTVLTALVFGVLPAMVMSRADPQDAMRQGLTSTASPGRHRLRAALTFAQMALASALLVSAGLLVNSLMHVMRVDPGFDATRVLSFRVTPPRTTYPDAGALNQFYDTLLTRLRHLPQVAHAGGVSGLPLAGSSVVRGVIRPGDPEPAPDALRLTLYQAATPGYVAAVGMRLRAGRDFTDSDTATATPVALVNHSLANELWPGADPIGREILVHTDEKAPRQVVGVLDDVRHEGLDARVYPQYFVPLAQSAVRTLSVAVKTNAALPSADVRRVVTALDPALPVYEVQTLDAVLNGSVSTRRAFTTGLSIFGGIALLLAAVGLSATVGSAVAERRREIGVRLALGATSNGIIAMFLRQGAMVAGLGAAAGLATSWLSTPLLEQMLFEVTALDLGTMATAVGVLLTVALAATWVAARPATRVNPLETLRGE